MRIETREMDEEISKTRLIEEKMYVSERNG